MGPGRAAPDVFDDYVAQGVSANLCKALGELDGHGKDRPVEIGLTWARGLPGPEPAPPVALSGSMVSVLAQAGAELEQLAKSEEAQITGQVETLNRTPGEPPRIKVVGEVRTERQTIVRRALWVIVSLEQYDQAIQAQREGWRVEAIGRLVTLQRRLEMRPRSFSVLPH